MQAVASLHELILLLLCLHVVPPEGGVTRVDLIEPSGVAAETILFERAGDGFLIREVRGESSGSPAGRARRVPGEPAVYEISSGPGSEDLDRHDLAAVFPDIGRLADLGTEADITSSEGVTVRFRRSGGVLYITPQGGPGTLVVQHLGPDPGRAGPGRRLAGEVKPGTGPLPGDPPNLWVGPGFSKVGGGLIIDWTPPTGGTVVFAEESNQVILITRSIGNDEPFETGPGDELLGDLLDYLFPGATDPDSGVLRDLRFGLYFKPEVD